MTIIYFVRHAEPNYDNHDDMLRELTAKGTQDAKLVSQYLKDKEIDVILSSPYKRAVDTVKPFAYENKMIIETINDFRERKVDSVWIDNFDEFCKCQWNDFDYKLSDGETLGEVQKRNVKALKQVLYDHRGKNIVIGTHGTALSTIINFYDTTFGYEEFHKIRYLMPWVVKFTFEDEICFNIEKINLL